MCSIIKRPLGSSNAKNGQLLHVHYPLKGSSSCFPHFMFSSKTVSSPLKQNSFASSFCETPNFKVKTCTTSFEGNDAETKTSPKTKRICNVCLPRHTAANLLCFSPNCLCPLLASFSMFLDHRSRSTRTSWTMSFKPNLTGLTRLLGNHLTVKQSCYATNILGTKERNRSKQHDFHAAIQAFYATLSFRLYHDSWSTKHKRAVEINDGRFF